MPESLCSNPAFQQLLQEYIDHFSLIWTRASIEYGIIGYDAILKSVIDTIRTLVSEGKIYDFKSINKNTSILIQQAIYEKDNDLLKQVIPYISLCLDMTYKHPLFRIVAREHYESWLQSKQCMSIEPNN